MLSKFEKNYDTVLNESYDYFNAQGVSIIGKGYEEIATNSRLFDNYVTRLTEGCSANDEIIMKGLMENTNKQILIENSITGIQPIASLSMPVIRKLWPKFALKEAIKNDIAKSPRIAVAYTRPYAQRADEKVYLPRGLKNEGLNTIRKTYVEVKKPLTVNDTTYASDCVVVTPGTVVEADMSSDPRITLTNTSSLIKKQPCDELIIEEVYSTDAFVADQTGTDTTTLHPVNETVTINGASVTRVKQNTAEKIYNTRMSVVGTRVLDLSDGQIIVTFSAEGKVTYAYVGNQTATPKIIKAKLGVSTEYNEDSWTIGYEIKRFDIDIPTGQHLNASLPIEQVNDAMAMYQINGLKEIVDIMTNMFAYKLDIEILEFIQNSFAYQPNHEAYGADGYPDYTEYVGYFDCIPQAGFAGSNAAWREELKRVITHYATKIIRNTYLQTGTFVVVGNPIDTDLISNVDWTFKAGANTVDGVDVGYTTGTYVAGNKTFKVISSPNVPEKALYLIFLPSGDSQETYKYYAYTFSTEMGYTDPNHTKVPSVMMTKRDTKYEFMPAIALISIANNNGSPYKTLSGTTDNEGKFSFSENPRTW